MLREFRTQRIIWDKANKRIFDPIQTSGGDQNGRRLEVQILNNGEVEDLTGTDLYLAWQTRNKNHSGLEPFDALDASEGIFELYYPTGMLAHAGALRGGLALVDSDGRIVSREFIIQVDRNIVDDEAVESSNEFTALTEALIKVNNLEENYAPQLQSVTAQLAQKVGGGVKAEPEDLSETTLGLVTGEGGPINLLSVPQDRSVTPEKTTFIKESSNLFNPILSVTGKRISLTGVVEDHSTWIISGYIPIEGDTDYYFSDFIEVSFYDGDTFINRRDLSAEGIVRRSPERADRMIVAYRISTDLSQALINKGSEPIPYEPYYVRLDGVTVNQTGIENKSVTLSKLDDDLQGVINNVQNVFITEGSVWN